CGRTSRRRRSAGLCRTRNPLNPRNRLPVQNGPGPADGSAAACPTDFSCQALHNPAPARTGRGAPSLNLPARTNRLLAPPAVAPHRAPAILLFPFLLISAASAASGRPVPDDDHTPGRRTGPDRPG